jgi:hypothetical protein
MPQFPKYVNMEWLSQNALRAYPLDDTATQKDTTAAFLLPKSLLLDLVFVVDQSLNLVPSGFHLSNVSVFATGVTLSFAYTDQSVTADLVATLNVSTASHQNGNSYYLYGQGDFAGMIGKATLGDLTTTLGFGGSYDFDIVGGRLLSRCFLPDIRGVTSLSITDGAVTSGPYYDDVIFQAGTNMRLSIQVVNGVNAIRFDALDNTDLNETCGCTTDTQLPAPITSINGIAPALDGSYTLVPKNCIDITDGISPSSLSIDDICSKPCCGEPELQVIQTDLDALSLDIRGIQHFQDLLNANLIELSTIKAAIQNTGVLGDNDAVDKPV